MIEKFSCLPLQDSFKILEDLSKILKTYFLFLLLQICPLHSTSRILVYFVLPVQEKKKGANLLFHWLWDYQYFWS